MYAEEYLGEDAQDYFEMSDVSIDESSSINTETRNMLKRRELYKRSDKYYYSYKRKIRTEDNESGEARYIYEKVEVYCTPLLTNSLIRNAVTGIRSEHYAGSKYDDLYFKGADLYTGDNPLLKNLPRKLYYDNPEQCERHLQIVIPNEVKEAWYEKYLRIRARM